ncbi:molybdopterin molybdotransferase MoeA [Aspergillus saccharolyticus JOP 1030-1]|uniref:molybdopterin adenylyltransferase n=1 Tax=Aspergillus saccharolyticus JOP 1030-1 TaxID=1450539 RepID=A0A318Z623_9EURO|nr:putative molybdenum cofactor biosynthesis protein [Aspergillus saccharolyticus JOP 1030-1]PYH40213.1 putative molybdenum cofactor biosynthesis protein [Aspergillus saccharolyticus JOP 1030-1]
MPLSYLDALERIRCEAEQDAIAFRSGFERLSIDKAVSRISQVTYRCHEATPKYDTSAMDGYALNSAATQSATPETPIIFRVCGTIAAGDEPLRIDNGTVSDIPPCVEIMTGAPFPQNAGDRQFDCCVRLEDVTAISVSGYPCIGIRKPATFQQNRRLAGGDFSPGDIIISAGQVIQPSHIMALASVGIMEVHVTRKTVVGVFSTGNEVERVCRRGQHHIADANGPYISASLQAQGSEVDFLGTLEDNSDAITHGIRAASNTNRYDVLISSGAVSAGKYDFVPSALQNLHVRQVFHKIAIRPGHPVLFAKIPISARKAVERGVRGDRYEVPFFGLPGNPVASAACLQFLVAPYLKHLQKQSPEPVLEATICQFGDSKPPDRALAQLLLKVPKDLDVFRPGVTQRRIADHLEVTPLEHSSWKVKPFLEANCWIHVPAGQSDVYQGDTVSILASH